MGLGSRCSFASAYFTSRILLN